MPRTDLTVRDAQFYRFVNVMAKRAKWIRNNLAAGEPASINAELGYGGARLMDVRWMGLKTIERLCECIHCCDGDSLKLRVTGSSAGNIIAYSLAMILAVKGRCCGYDVKQPKRRGTIIDRWLFYCTSGLRIARNIKCACEAIRVTADLLFEMAAVQEHPAWHDSDCNDRHDSGEQDNNSSSSGQVFPGLKSSTHHRIPTNTIQEMFSGKKTAESVLSFSQGTAASGFSDLFIEAPVQYALSMYRAIDRLEGRVGVLYCLSRFLVLFCVVWDKNDGQMNPFFNRCEFYIGARKVTGDGGFLFTDLVGTDSVPLVKLIGNATTPAVEDDVERFNNSVDILMDSIDVKEVVLPWVARVIWQRTLKRLNLKNNKTIVDVRNWRWDGTVPTTRTIRHNDYETKERCQIASDIMTNSAGGYLPDFEKMVNDSTGREGLLCWNYVFELSPLGKHLFSLDRVSALIEASLPLVTPWQLNAVQKRRGRKMVACSPRARLE